MSTLATVSIAIGASAATLGLLAGGAAYASRWPGSQIFGRTLIDAPETNALRHTVWLTYDDGPSERNTPALLDLLAKHKTKATFFLIGNHVRKYPELTRRIAEEGHALGNHTDMHPALARKDEALVREELEHCQQTIVDATGMRPALFRPPYGSRRPAVLRIAREMGLTPVLWNVTAKDWQPIGPARILANVNRGMQRNRGRHRISNILLHDASHLDSAEAHSRADTLKVTANLLARSDLRFARVTAPSF